MHLTMYFLRNASPLLLGLLVILVILAASQVTFAEQGNGPEYTVEPGDSLYSVALAFGSTVEALQAVNGISDPSLIGVGQRLMVPGFEDISGLLAIRSLAASDTLFSLDYGLDADRMALVRLNRLVNPAALYLGQPLIYPLVEGPNDTSTGTGRLVMSHELDTLAGLAARLGCSMVELALQNGLSSLADNYPGRRIFTPAAEPVSGLPSPMTGLQIVPVHPAQGEPMAVVVAMEQGAILSATFSDETLHFAADGETQVAFSGIHALAEPGVYPLVIRVTLPDGEAVAFETRVPISDAKYQHQAIWLPEHKAALLDDLSEVEAARIHGVTTSFIDQKAWTTRFTPPVASEYITATFALRRSYNGGPYETFHGGIDFGAPGATEIRAPAAGVVVMAEPLQIRGNTTIIDHGWGVYSGYWHQSRMLVSIGQMVMAGETIGYVGNTGLSTGTHLHWEMWVGGNQVNPMAWMALEGSLQR